MNYGYDSDTNVRNLHITNFQTSHQTVAFEGLRNAHSQAHRFGRNFPDQAALQRFDGQLRFAGHCGVAAADTSVLRMYN